MSELTELDAIDPIEAAPGSALAAIRDKRKEIADRKTLTLNVPGYAGLVGIRYKAINPKRYEQLSAKAARAKDEALFAVNADLIIESCEEILVRQDRDLEWEPIIPGETTTFQTGTLGAALAMNIPSARKGVVALFSPEGQQAAAPGVHADAIFSWLKGESDEIDKALLGE